MINIDFANINNAKLIGRLLPFWARGKKVSLLLQAILYPIASVHNLFKIWALEKFIECHITAQKASLEWYLRYKLKSHFIMKMITFSLHMALMNHYHVLVVTFGVMDYIGTTTYDGTWKLNH